MVSDSKSNEFKIASIYYLKRFLFFCKIVKNKTIGFRTIHDSLFEQNTLWSRVFGLRISEKFPATFKGRFHGSFSNVSCHFYNTFVWWNS
jgi:hypothetical protein